MNAVTFDTYKFVERLEKAGIPRAQAAAFAEAQRDSMGEAELATKRDLREMELRLDGELKLNRWMLALVVVAEAAPFIKNFFG